MTRTMQLSSMLPVLQLFLQSGQRRRLLTGLLLAVLTVLFGMALLGLSGWFLTACYVAGLSSAAALAFDVFAPGAGVRLLSVLRTAARYGERVVTHDATLRVLAHLRVRLFGHFAAPDVALALRQRPARLLFRLTSDIDALDAVYLRLFTPAVALLASAAATALILGSFLDWRSGLLTGAIVLLGGAACVAWCLRRGFVTAVRRSFAGEHLRAAVIDAVGGQTELVMVGGLPRQLQRALAAEHQQYTADMMQNRAESRVGLAMAMVGHAATACALLCGALLASQGHIGAPIVALGTLVLLAALEPLTNIRRGAMEAGRTLLAARRLAPAFAPEESAVTLPQPPAGLAAELRATSVRGGPAIDLRVAAGEWVALAGASGAGKSSLLALLSGDESATGGTVAALRCVSLPQRTELFHDSIAGNLRIAKPDATADELWAVLAAAGLADMVRALPQQLATPLGSQGAGLSGGESRRLAVARTLLQAVPLVLLDEPTEGLDAATATQVMAALQTARRHAAIVMASHMQREVCLADRIVWIGDGGGVVQQAVRGTSEFARLLLRLRPG